MTRYFTIENNYWIGFRVRAGWIIAAWLVFRAAGLSAQEVEWVVGIGGAGNESGTAIVADEAGNVYTTGSFWDVTNFNPSGSVIYTPADGDMFVLKNAPNGDYVWSKQITGISTQAGHAITRDVSGNVLVSGMFWNTADFSSGTGGTPNISHGWGDIVVLKLDANGNYRWSKSMGGAYSDVSRGIATDREGSVYTTGHFTGTVDFNPDPAQVYNISSASAGEWDIFLSKLDSNGNFVWAKGFGSNGWDEQGLSVATDAADNIYVVGYYYSVTNFNPGGSIPAYDTSNGGQDVFIAKYDKNGNYLWSKGIGGSGSDLAYSVATDRQGNVYAAGIFSDNVNFNPRRGVNMLGSPGGSVGSSFIAKYDSDGNYIWAKELSGTQAGGGVEIRSVVVDVVGNVHVTGSFSGAVDFDPSVKVQTLTTAAGRDAFVAKYDRDGNYIRAKKMGGISGGETGMGIYVHNSGSTYLVGEFEGTAEFEPDQPGLFRRTSNGGNDFFIARLSCGDTSLSFASEVVNCNGYMFDGVLYKNSGRYALRLNGAHGCDSTVILDLTVNTDLDVLINVAGIQLSTVTAYQTYQWIRNDTAIPGATSSIYTVTQNGRHRVAVADPNGCLDTSGVYYINNVSVASQEQVYNDVRIYPNPVSSFVYVSAPAGASVILTAPDGRRLIETVSGPEPVFLDHFPEGLYLVEVRDVSGALLKVEKIIKRGGE